ncbi:MAG: hypothetical protein CMJ47_05735 [Planctomyces sp.]|nr:hypothetical protein [Planctomyces sp.]
MKSVLGSLLMLLVLASVGFAQDESGSTAPPATDPPAETTEETVETTEEEAETDLNKTLEDAAETAQKTAKEAGEYVSEQSEKVRQQLDESEEAKEVSAGILNPIYSLAEYMSFASFHWVAFALMVSGVVSFALQLVLGKLVVLARGGFSLVEIFGDAQAFLISLVGLFLTTQAAAENSTFTESAGAVLTATAVGLVVGIIFYYWGQSIEIQAVKGRRVEQREEKARRK